MVGRLVQRIALGINDQRHLRQQHGCAPLRGLDGVVELDGEGGYDYYMGDYESYLSSKGIE